MFLVYVDVRTDGTPFYVGKGTKLRTQDFTRNAWHASIRKKDCGWDRVVVFETTDEDEALEKEKQLIKKFGRRQLGLGPLVNLTDGGEGVSGLKHSETTKKKLSAMVLGELNPNYGKPKTDSIKAKISASNVAAVTPALRQQRSMFMTGRPMSDATRLKIGAAFKGVKQSAENIQKRKDGFTAEKRLLMAARVVASMTPERRKQMSEIRQGVKRSAEDCAKISAGQIGTKRTAQARANMSVAQTKRGAPTAATRGKMRESALNRDVKVNERIAASVSALMTPEYRAVLSAKTKSFSRKQVAYLTATMQSMPQQKVTRAMINEFESRGAAA